MIPTKKIEALRRAAAEELQRLQGEFESAGLTWVLRDSDMQQEYETFNVVELSIWFYRNGEPVDFLEGFLFRDGMVVVSEEDVRSWVQQGAKDVIASEGDG